MVTCLLTKKIEQKGKRAFEPPSALSFGQRESVWLEAPDFLFSSSFEPDRQSVAKTHPTHSFSYRRTSRITTQMASSVPDTATVEKFFTIRKTVIEMLLDRGYLVSENEIKLEFNDFHAKLEQMQYKYGLLTPQIDFLVSETLLSPITDLIGIFSA